MGVGSAACGARPSGRTAAHPRGGGGPVGSARGESGAGPLTYLCSARESPRAVPAEGGRGVGRGVGRAVGVRCRRHVPGPGRPPARRAAGRGAPRPRENAGRCAISISAPRAMRGAGTGRPAPETPGEHGRNPAVFLPRRPAGRRCAAPRGKGRAGAPGAFSGARRDQGAIGADRMPPRPRPRAPGGAGAVPDGPSAPAPARNVLAEDPLIKTAQCLRSRKLPGIPGGRAANRREWSTIRQSARHVPAAACIDGTRSVTDRQQRIRHMGFLFRERSKESSDVRLVAMLIACELLTGVSSPRRASAGP